MYLYRLFVALDLPETVRLRLAGLARGIPGARWIAAEQIHLTLRFIGEVDGGLFDDVAEALRAVRGEPFPLRLYGVGHFPPSGPPRQLWAGVEKNPPLIALQRAIENALTAAGLEPERRKFVPHVTLARLNGAPLSRIAAFLSENGLFACDPFTVEAFNLYSSRLGNQGPSYRVEVCYPLGRAPGERPEDALRSA